jgi:hypothetical protein
MSEFRPFGICINRCESLKSVFHTVAQGRLVGLEFYQKITSFFLILSMMSFCMDMA